jgi:hypothetical protein
VGKWLGREKKSRGIGEAYKYTVLSFAEGLREG